MTTTTDTLAALFDHWCARRRQFEHPAPDAAKAPVFPPLCA